MAIETSKIFAGFEKEFVPGAKIGSFADQDSEQESDDGE